MLRRRGMCLIYWVDFEDQFSVTAGEDFFVDQGYNVAELVADDVAVFGGLVVCRARCGGHEIGIRGILRYWLRDTLMPSVFRPFWQIAGRSERILGSILGSIWSLWIGLIRIEGLLSVVVLVGWRWCKDCGLHIGGRVTSLSTLAEDRHFKSCQREGCMRKSKDREQERG